MNDATSVDRGDTSPIIPRSATPSDSLNLTTATETEAFAFCRAHEWTIEVGYQDIWARATTWPDVMRDWDELERHGQLPQLRAGTGNSVSTAATTSAPDKLPEYRSNTATCRSLANIERLEVPHETPTTVFLEEVAVETFRSAATTATLLSSTALAIQIAYSIKTNPDPRLLAIAHAHGFLLEAISQHEVAAAQSASYPECEIVLNGPAKWWPRRMTTRPVHAIFCDSLEELTTLSQADGIPASVVGVRLRPPTARSRFGVDVARPDVRARLVHLLRTLPMSWTVGFHFHIQSSVVGTRRWWQTFDSMIEIIRGLEIDSARPIQCLDIGGGWDPDDWNQHLFARLPDALRAMKIALPNVRALIIEPGKALTQTSSATAMRVIEVRRDAMATVTEIVVDGSVAEVPQFYNYPHSIAIRDSSLPRSGWHVLGRGNGRILGRLCMEKDIIASHLDIPGSIEIGDVIFVLDTGAYDRSTAYSFGLGSSDGSQSLMVPAHAD